MPHPEWRAVSGEQRRSTVRSGALAKLRNGDRAWARGRISVLVLLPTARELMRWSGRGGGQGQPAKTWHRTA